MFVVVVVVVVVVLLRRKANSRNVSYNNSSRQRNTVLSLNLSMPPIRIGEPPRSHKYSMTAWTSWPKITAPQVVTVIQLFAT